MKHPTFIISLFLIYILVTTALMIKLGIGIAPDRYIFVLFFAAIFVKRVKSFVLDWIPFLFIILSYDWLRGMAGILNSRVYYLPQLQFDQIVFGVNPSVYLQSHFFNPSQLAWYDYASTILYFLHFALPLAFGYLLWLQKRQYFKEFVTGISLVSYAAWLTYIAFPAAPPWLATQKGILPGLTKILDQTLSSFPQAVDLPTFYHRMNPNMVAAVPSMHAAYPFLVLLFALSFFGKKALLFIPYVLVVWVSIVYLGEHYVSDVLAGALYAFIFFLLTIKLIHRKGHRAEQEALTAN